MSIKPSPSLEKKLHNALKENPDDWEARKSLAHHLYDKGSFSEAADIIWEAAEIPSIDLELAFAARVLAKAAPRKAIRLLTAVLEKDQGKAVQHLGLANALLHHGMVLQAARFYGAAMEADPSLGNADLEHFMLWTDDEETLWGDFKDRKPKLGDLPWMKRDPMEAMKLTTTVSHHTSPIKVPNLDSVPGEELTNELYQQKAEKGAEASPPPAVTIPVDRVDPKHRLVDPKRGAADPSVKKKTKEPQEPAPVAKKPQAPKAAAKKPQAPVAVAKPTQPVQKSTPPSPAPPTIKLNTPKTMPPTAGPQTRKLQFAKPAETDKGKS
ncbi:hypothetical protein [Haloferula sp.]|uniref:hypothetical protein n=1 Tax=Haloferula sp. TaxID=2497595 RepID=UPI0032A107D9